MKSFLVKLQRITSKQYEWLEALVEDDVITRGFLDESIDQLTKDRFQLAVQFYEYCKGTKTDMGIDGRNIISRGYCNGS